jgi:hypothetical protein
MLMFDPLKFMIVYGLGYGGRVGFAHHKSHESQAYSSGGHSPPYYTVFRNFVGWVPLLACPAVQGDSTLLDKPAVAPTILK